MSSELVHVAAWTGGAIVSVGAVIGGLAQLDKVRRAAIRAWQTIPAGRRQVLARQLQRLRVGDTIATFKDRLGEPQIEDHAGSYVRYVFELSDARVTAFTDDHGKVLRYRVTTVSRTFKPRITLTRPGAHPQLSVGLGRDSFAQVHTPCAVAAFVGASTMTYRELHYLGRPGDYRHFVTAVDPHGVPGLSRTLLDAMHELSFPEPATLPFTEAALELLDNPLLINARQQSIINSFEVLDPAYPTEEWLQWG